MKREDPRQSHTSLEPRANSLQRPGRARLHDRSALTARSSRSPGSRPLALSNLSRLRAGAGQTAAPRRLQNATPRGVSRTSAGLQAPEGSPSEIRDRLPMIGSDSSELAHTAFSETLAIAHQQSSRESQRHDCIPAKASARSRAPRRSLQLDEPIARRHRFGEEVITRAAISGAIASRRNDRRLEGGHVARKVRLGHRAVATTMTLIGLCFGASGAHRGCAQRQLTQCLPIGTRRSFARGRVGTRFATDAGGEATLWRGLPCRSDRAIWCERPGAGELSRR
jgi:hypothetical protein